MRTKRSHFTIMLISFFLLCNCVQAEEINKLMDNFYDGLAGVIETNTASPDKCIAEVENYYLANKATVDKIRSITQKAMAEAMPMMEDYESMSEEELQALENRANNMAGRTQASSPGLDRYSKAIQQFSMKYPMHGMKIAMKATEFLSNKNSE